MKEVSRSYRQLQEGYMQEEDTELVVLLHAYAPHLSKLSLIKVLKRWPKQIYVFVFTCKEK